MTTSSRKLDHIRICLEKPVDAKKWPFQDLVLLHKALPEIDEKDIDTSCVFLGRKRGFHDLCHDRRPSRPLTDQRSPGGGGSRARHCFGDRFTKGGNRKQKVGEYFRCSQRCCA